MAGGGGRGILGDRHFNPPRAMPSRKSSSSRPTPPPVADIPAPASVVPRHLSGQTPPLDQDLETTKRDLSPRVEAAAEPEAAREDPKSER